MANKPIQAAAGKENDRHMDTTRNSPFLKIKDACKVTGLSQYFLRNGCKAGTIPHIRSGSTYYVNVPALLRKLDEGSVYGS